MTVWIVNPFDNLPAEGFRPQRYWLMAQAFADAGHDVTLFTSDFNHTTKAPRNLADPIVSRASSRGLQSPADPIVSRASSRGLHLSLIPTRPYRSNVSLSRIRSHLGFVRSLRAELLSRAAGLAPDLVVVSLPLIGTAAVALELKRRYGTKVVVDIMDDWPGTFLRLFPRWLRPLARLALAPLRRAAERAYREADLVTGVADRYAELALGAGARRYLRFYHGIEMSRPREDARLTVGADGPREDARLTVGEPRMLYLGNLGRTYDLKTAIEAVALDQRFALDIAGKGDQEEALKSFAAAKGVADRVRFHGYLGEAALAELAAHCAYGLVPMSDDSCVGVPYKFADYARYGLFILSSLRGESAALLEKYRCGALYTSGDPRSLLSAISCAAGLSNTSPCLRDSSFLRVAPQASLLSEFDASTIYRSYVQEVTK